MRRSEYEVTLPPTKSKRSWIYVFFLVGVTAIVLYLVVITLLSLSEPVTYRTNYDSYQLSTTYTEDIYVPELPLQLFIPSIGVSTTVQIVGLADDDTGAMGVPDNFTDVGWYKHGPRPGMVGSAVIAGHYNGKNLPKAIFYDLSELEINDTVEVIDENGTSLIFQVVKMRTYSYNEATEEVFVSNDGKVRLNLITCGGSWLKDEKLYDQRTVVFTELVI